MIKQDKMKQINCRPIADDQERAEAMSIRRQVFVTEQGMFDETDEDQYDSRAIHLIAEVEGSIVGTVRLYREKDDVWVGGRLAVLPEFRGRVGAGLVRRAVIEADRHGAKKFKACVQAQNESFFQKLEWETVGEKILIWDIEHVRMLGPIACKDNEAIADSKKEIKNYKIS